MTRRINPDTGYPMSTEKQIQQAKDLLYLSEPHLSDEEIEANLTSPYSSKEDKLRFFVSTLTSPYEYKADYFYKIGDYDEAEKDYLQIFFLNFNFANKLRILYQREKRYKDALYITDFTLNTFNDFPFLCTKKEKEQLQSNLSKIQKLADSHFLNDQSVIQGEDKVWLVKTTGSKLNQIADFSKNLDKVNSKLQHNQNEYISSTSPKNDSQEGKDEDSNLSSEDKFGYGCIIGFILLGIILGAIVDGFSGAIIGFIAVVFIAVKWFLGKK